MKELINILRQQLILCRRLLEISEAQRTEFSGKDAGTHNAQLTHEMEDVLARTMMNSKAQDKFLAGTGAQDTEAFLAGQPMSREKMLARELLEKLTSTMQQLKKINAANQQLLDRHIQFINFNVNVMTQVSSGPTYAPAQGARQQESARTKMFDKNI